MSAAPPLPLAGGCLCGAVRYRIDAGPTAAGNCHCASCRRAAGAQSVAWGTFPSTAFAWTGAEPTRHASSPGVTRTHCARCGTSLTWQDEADTIDVTLASLDDPAAVAPRRESWLSHRLPWAAVDPALPGFPEGGS